MNKIKFFVGVFFTFLPAIVALIALVNLTGLNPWREVIKVVGSILLAVCSCCLGLRLINQSGDK